MLWIFGIYASVGLAFSLPFVWLGVESIDARAREGGWGFRLILIPAAAALWPYLAWRWSRSHA